MHRWRTASRGDHASITMAERSGKPALSPRALIAAGFGAGFWAFAALAVAAGTACYVILGGDAFAEALGDDMALLAATLPRIVIALGIAGLVWVLLPRDRLSALIGLKSGWSGLAVAAAAGIVTPGGPASAFSLLAVLAGAGADRGALVTYITAWSMLGLQRILVWDVPFMGVEFTAIRFLISLPLVILAGLIARRLPLELRLADAYRPPEDPRS